MPLDQLFRLLGDETRLRCLLLLQQCGELCVCDLVSLLGLNQSKVSRHLGLLRGAQLVEDERRGQWVFYRIHPRLPLLTQQLLQAAFAHGRELSPFLDDRLAAEQRLLQTTEQRCGEGCC